MNPEALNEFDEHQNETPEENLQEAQPETEEQTEYQSEEELTGNSEEINSRLSNRWLPLPLKLDQKAEMADKMSELRILAEKLDEQKKSSAKSYNNQIESVQNELLEISRIIETGSKETEVECECKWNFPKDGTVSYYNADGEQIYQREMTDPEIEAQAEPSMFEDQPEPEESDSFDDSYEVVDEGTGENHEVNEELEIPDDESFEEAEEEINQEAKDQ